MHIFITGIAGFLGSNLANHFLDKGHKVSGNDNLVGGDLNNLNPKVKFYKKDCENYEFNKSVFKDVDIVVHSAAYAHEGLSNFAPYLISKNVFSSSVSVFTAAIENKVKRIVFMSSMARYGSGSGKIFKETDIPKPVDPYGIAKLAAEDVLKNLSKTHGIEYNIAVPHNIIGPNQRYVDPFRNVAAIMINLILQNRRPVIYGDGKQMRCFSDVRDCIYCIDKLTLDKRIKSQIFNIGPDENYVSINELFNIISNKLKFNKEPTFFPDRPNEVKKANCLADKSRKILKYKTKYSIEDSIDSMIDDIKKKGTKKFIYNYDIEINSKILPSTWKNKFF
jgi:UDP-glucose 4-epimerase